MSWPRISSLLQGWWIIWVFLILTYCLQHHLRKWDSTPHTFIVEVHAGHDHLYTLPGLILQRPTRVVQASEAGLKESKGLLNYDPCPCVAPVVPLPSSCPWVGKRSEEVPFQGIPTVP
ncbi:hypothetical protein Pmani_010038 [Petrolisthes manimaculis]|uniref:Uncharacterized protein n=1 Tax=Petrolisthes manimaculis TaxID=1843537 RepID=A0AAE1UHP8_9EUCA|nr:hypothetical protein Pmani_010038 [Petrolisthes manimaculis]